MEDIKEFKDMWDSLNLRITNLEEENRNLARRIISNKNFTAREKLIRKYNLFIVIEAIMIVYINLMLLYNPAIVEKYRLVTMIYWTIFFFIEIGIDFYLKTKVEQIDVYQMSVREISRLAAANWKLHKIAIAAGIPLAIGAIILFALAMDANIFVIYGMFVGGIIGFLIGLVQLRKFMGYYRLLQEDRE